MRNIKLFKLPETFNIICNSIIMLSKNKYIQQNILYLDETR